MTNRLPQPPRQRIADLSAKDQERLTQLVNRRARQGGIATGDQATAAIARLFGVDQDEVQDLLRRSLLHMLGR